MLGLKKALFRLFFPDENPFFDLINCSNQKILKVKLVPYTIS
jgi:hypothetical protein